jgi:hypothetical protein
MADLGQAIISRLDQLKKVRLFYESLWRDIARFVNPRRENIRQTDLTLPKGQRRGKGAYDGSPNGALNVWADGMQGFLVSASQTWFRSVIFPQYLNEIDEVRQWCQEYDEQIFAAFRRSNFYAALPEWFRDVGSIGTGTLYTDEDIGDRRCIHTAIHPREVYIAENKFGEVDTVYREFQMTARQIVQKFDDKKIPDHVKNQLKPDQNTETEYVVVHAVYPNSDRVYGTLTPIGKKWRSVYVLKGSASSTDTGKAVQAVLKQGGYDVFPYATWRYRKNSDEIYGYSPAADSIIEIFGLNELGKDMLQAAQKAVNPPMNVPYTMRREATTLPGGFNYYRDPKMLMTPTVTGINWPIPIEQQQRFQVVMEDKYRVEFFLTLARAARQMTAYEVQERKSEKAVLMGPQTDRLKTEGLGKVFDIVSEIEDRAGRLPEMPAILTDLGERVDIEFTGPLPVAQKQLFEMQPIRQAINELAPIAALKPEVMDRINWTELPEHILKATNFPQKLILTDEQVKEIQTARAQKEQQAEQMEMAGAAADAVPKLSKPIDETSPLGLLTKG